MLVGKTRVTVGILTNFGNQSRGSPPSNIVLFFYFVQVLALHQFDCARANKSTCAWGLEARVPFLDVDFIDLVMSISPEDKVIKRVCV